MGFLSKLTKGIGKALKGIGKALKKTVKGVVKLGKKVLSGIGGFMGKLGPLGTIAIGMMMPYAIPAMQSSSIGWVQSLGNGLASAGSSIGGWIKGIGEGTSFSGITEGIGNYFSSWSKAGNIAEGAANLLGDNASVGLFKSSALGETSLTPTLDASASQGLFESKALGEGVGITAQEAGATSALRGAEAMKSVFAPQESLLSKMVKEGAKALSGMGQGGGGTPTMPIDTSGYALSSAQVGSSTGPAGGGTSFIGQDLTGLLKTEEFAQRQASLLGRR